MANVSVAVAAFVVVLALAVNNLNVVARAADRSVAFSELVGLCNCYLLRGVCLA